jgi:hypothetical protein
MLWLDPRPLSVVHIHQVEDTAAMTTAMLEIAEMMVEVTETGIIGITIEEEIDL